jgi:hypothetical protein
VNPSLEARTKTSLFSSVPEVGQPTYHRLGWWGDEGDVCDESQTSNCLIWTCRCDVGREEEEVEGKIVFETLKNRSFCGSLHGRIHDGLENNLSF